MERHNIEREKRGGSERMGKEVGEKNALSGCCRDVFFVIACRTR